MNYRKLVLSVLAAGTLFYAAAETELAAPRTDLASAAEAVACPDSASVSESTAPKSDSATASEAEAAATVLHSDPASAAKSAACPDSASASEATAPQTDLASETEAAPVSLADVPQGLYEIASAADSSFVLDVKHCTVKDEDSRTLQMYRSLDVNQQKFYLEDLPGVACRLSALHSGDALTASGDGLTVSLTAMERPENAPCAAGQSWRLQEAGDGSYYIRSANGSCLTLEASEPYSGAVPVLREFSGASNQRWLLIPAWISTEAVADTDLINPYGEDGVSRNLRLALRFDSGYEVIRSEELASHMTETDDHQLTLDPDYLSSFVAQLAQKYDTQGKPRRFHTSYGTDITLYKGNFGWKLDEEGTKELLEDALQLTGPKTLAPVWSHRGGTFGETSDIGDSYVEIDLENQKVWLYQNGKQLLETDCVSGTFGTDRQTPGGVYSIFYMQSPDVLNGADYASHVEYWMAFNGNIGMHDANWRGEFGGDIFRTNGSHGCVNLPTEAAKQIYETVSLGYPVVCYQ